MQANNKKRNTIVQMSDNNYNVYLDDIQGTFKMYLTMNLQKDDNEDYTLTVSNEGKIQDTFKNAEIAPIFDYLTQNNVFTSKDLDREMMKEIKGKYNALISQNKVSLDKCLNIIYNVQKQQAKDFSIVKEGLMHTNVYNAIENNGNNAQHTQYPAILSQTDEVTQNVKVDQDEKHTSKLSLNSLIKSSTSQFQPGGDSDLPTEMESKCDSKVKNTNSHKSTGDAGKDSCRIF